MAAGKGRSFVVKKNGTTLLGVKSKTVDTTHTPIEITSDDDSGYTTYMDEAGVSSQTISVDFVVKDTILRQQILSGNTTIKLTDVTLEYPNGDTVSGDYVLTKISDTGASDGPLEGSAEFLSSGAWTYTAA